MTTTRAPAKVNLSLSVLGRRADGYHELDSLVAFAGCGDDVTFLPDAPAGLSLAGPFAAHLGAEDDNLVLKAARAFAALDRATAEAPVTGAFRLVKRLPVASGIGGGSADAAAALRLLARHRRVDLDDPALLEAARRIGADVPVCLASRSRRMRGAGEALGPPLRLPRLFAVLVNPGVAVSTAAVFGRLGLKPGDAYSGAAPVALASSRPTGEALLAALIAGGNDLQGPALALAPAIGDVLDALGAQAACRLSRMSGSGATCFGLFDDCRASAAAARTISRRHPAWWVKATVLR